MNIDHGKQSFADAMKPAATDAQPKSNQTISYSDSDGKGINNKFFTSPENEPPEPEIENTQEESTEVTEPETPSKEPKISEKDFLEKFNRLTESEKQIRAMELRLKAQQEELDLRKKELESSSEKYKDNPFELLSSYGFDFENVMERYLAEDGETQTREDPANNAALEEIRKLKEELKQRDEESKKAQEAAEQERQITEYKATIKKHLTDESDKYPMINDDGVDKHLPMVFDIIAAHAQEFGSVMDFSEAAQMVEAELLSDLKRKASSPALQKMLGISSTPSQPAEQKQSPLASNKNVAPRQSFNKRPKRAGSFREHMENR